MLQVKSFDNNILIPEVVRLLNEGHTVTMTVKGRSMRPFIENGRDKVLLTLPDDIKVGDVVLAKTEEKGYVIHRLTKLDEASGQCVLRGDGNLDLEHCHTDEILAKVVEFIRKKQQKRYSVKGRTWRIYSWWWMRLLPIRRYLLGLHRRLVIRNKTY